VIFFRAFLEPKLNPPINGRFLAAWPCAAKGHATAEPAITLMDSRRCMRPSPSSRSRDDANQYIADWRANKRQAHLYFIAHAPPLLHIWFGEFDRRRSGETEAVAHHLMAEIPGVLSGKAERSRQQVPRRPNDRVARERRTAAEEVEPSVDPDASGRTLGRRRGAGGGGLASCFCLLERPIYSASVCRRLRVFDF
jgi:hypothetical protein